MSVRSSILCAIALCAVLTHPLAALAASTAVTPVDLASCDTLAMPNFVEELGTGPGFILGLDRLSAAQVDLASPNSSGCADNPVTANAQFQIFNQTSTAFEHVYYVADTDSTMSNADGTVNGGLAFKIDAVGANTPLLSEDMTQDGIFEVGERWVFVIDDFTNLQGISPALLSSLGVGPDSLSDTSSSGSIIAFVPEPSTALLLGMGLLGLRRRR